MPKAKFKMIRKAQQYSSPTKYLVMTDTYACRVGVFTGSQGNWELLYYWKCSPGKDSTPTALGTFQVGMKVWFFGDGFRCWYATQYNGNYLFHSILYNYDGTVQDGTLGERVSHGCIRLAISHAKWMYDNLPEHTTCINY